MTQRILIANTNRVDDGTLSGGSWLASLPLTNLQTRPLAQVARSNGVSLAATKFDIDLTTPRKIGVLALVVHNITVVGKVRVQGADNPAFSAPLYDSGWLQVWPAGLIPQDLLEWEDDNFWLGTLSQSARASYQSPFILRTTNSASIRYWRVEIDDTANADGYVHIGRLFISESWQPSSANYGFGAQLGYEDPTVIEESLGGTEYYDRRQRFRVFRFDLPYVTEDEAYSRVLELQRLSGTSGEVLVIPDPDDATNQVRRAFVGRLRALSGIAQPHNAVFTASFELKELL